MKTRLLLASVIALAAIGCDSGDTPIETVQLESTPAPAPTTPDAPPADMKSAIESHPTMPDAAKNAVLGKR